MADKARHNGVICVRDLWLRGIASQPNLESPSTSRRVLLCIPHHHGHRFLGAFDSGIILHGELVNVVRENRSVRIRKWAAIFQSRQSFGIYMDNLHTVHVAENCAVLCGGHCVISFFPALRIHSVMHSVVFIRARPLPIEGQPTVCHSLLS